MRNQKISRFIPNVFGMPYSTIMLWPTDTPPDGWLECNGASLAVADYPLLHDELGYKYGGSGANFNLPDLRGYFNRGWDNGAGVDPDRGSRLDRGDGTTGDNVGTLQTHNNLSHTHAQQRGNSPCPNSSCPFDRTFYSTTRLNFTGVLTNFHGSNEARPLNINKMPIMRAY